MGNFTHTFSHDFSFPNPSKTVPRLRGKDNLHGLQLCNFAVKPACRQLQQKRNAASMQNCPAALLRSARAVVWRPSSSRSRVLRQNTPAENVSESPASSAFDTSALSAVSNYSTVINQNGPLLPLLSLTQMPSFVLNDLDQQEYIEKASCFPSITVQNQKESIFVYIKPLHRPWCFVHKQGSDGALKNAVHYLKRAMCDYFQWAVGCETKGPPALMAGFPYPHVYLGCAVTFQEKSLSQGLYFCFLYFCVS